MSTRLVATLVASSLLLAQRFPAQSYVHTPIGVAGANYTQPTGANDAGLVVGWYGPCGDHAGCSHIGFLRDNQVVSTFSAPGVDTRILGVNDHGDVVGWHTQFDVGSGTFYTRGFLRLADGTFASHGVVGANETKFTAINASGEIAGTYTAFDGSHAFVLSGYAVAGGALAGGLLDESAFPPSSSVVPHAISDSGVVAGSYTAVVLGNQVVHGFVRAGGAWHQYDSPNVPSGFLAQTEIRGINDAGDLLGDVPGQAFVLRGYALSGGLVVGGTEELIDLPGTSTQGFRAIDSAGRLVGFENLPVDASQAYLLTPQSGGAGLAGSGGLVPLHYTKGGTAKVGNAGFRYAADALVGGSVGFLYVGLSALALPLFGGTAWVGPPQVLFLSQPTAGTPGLAGSGRLDIATPIPADPSLAGLVLHSQVFVLDFAALQQIAMSQGGSLVVRP